LINSFDTFIYHYRLSIQDLTVSIIILETLKKHVDHQVISYRSGCSHIISVVN